MRDLPEDSFNHLLTLFGQGRLRELVREAALLAQQHPDSSVLHNISGAAHAGLRDWDAAVASYRRALQIRPDYAEAHNNLGAALNDAGAPDEAVASYRRALAIKPGYAEAHNNLGVALKNRGALEQAVASYRRALEINPNYAEAHNNLGVALTDSGAPDEAMESYRAALVARPEYAEAHNNLGATLLDNDASDEAVASYRRALEIRPDFAEARAKKLHLQAHMCDWAAIEEDAASIPKLGVEGGAVFPFSMLAMEDDPERHRQRAERYARESFTAPPPAVWPKPDARPERLRVGYFSADFHNHATMYLMASLFGAHDRRRFEIRAYSYGIDSRDAMRRRLVDTVDGFEDVRGMSDEAVAELARAHGLDIAVDLKGYTNEARPGIFAYRAAPIQISYLGYPGTMGAPFIDYLIADDAVIPEAQRVHYTESVIYLPHSYQVNDDTRAIAECTTARAAFGLPEDAFVFCCFNHPYKIGPGEFDVWMRLLNQVDGSVLWLFRANKWAESNLRKEAEARGVDGRRLVFGEHVEVSKHLARLRLADLFLDTFTYTAHTTASDALWAGLPVLTKLGQGFAARVGGSLLRAVGLPELVTEKTEDYERLALELASSPDRLDAIKEKLARNITTEPLFDTALFAKGLEEAYRQAYKRYADGQRPATIRVAAVGDPGSKGGPDVSPAPSNA